MLKGALNFFHATMSLIKLSPLQGARISRITRPILLIIIMSRMDRQLQNVQRMEQWPTSCCACGCPISYERDMCNLVCLIICCGIFALCCLPKREPICVQCGLKQDHAREIEDDLELETAFFSAQRCIFVVTSFLNAISMFCLIKKVPRNQAGVRNYLIVIQVVVIILISVYLDVLFEPIPLVPATACYYVGVLHGTGLRPDTVLTTRPPASIKRIRHSLTVLFIQIAVPFFTMIIPAALLFISVHCECIPFAINLPIFAVLALHPLAHNLCLLSITPQFRKLLFSGIRGNTIKNGPIAYERDMVTLVLLIICCGICALCCLPKREAVCVQCGLKQGYVME
ncbi:hypothetical protein PRIPAC_90757 [Pristionchus pacificus]|uniref:G protein-coupled receptor n=1 Tax=Pristionchus pacificus TaxID=54126 RepID=A0A2A6CT37_PRIPA|nr:hypothetical protein PRIPAC_90757 [Pristionchus pacificus]|eukprot:PDM81355.1 G protein-coupled receptor [Pristionchus pacificus]